MAHLSPQHVNNMAATNLIRVKRMNKMMLGRQTGRGEWVPCLAIYATRMDFDWPAFVGDNGDNKNNTSLLGEDRV